MSFKKFLFALLAASMIPLALAQEAFVPSNPNAMRPLTNHQSPAYQTAKLFMRGANLGNYLEAPPKEDWGVRISTEDFDHIKAEGFDHIRVPVGWHHYAGPGPDFKLSAAIFQKVDFVLTNALSRGLAVMLNIHHFNEFTTGPAKESDKFIAIWKQIAAHYRDLPPNVIFELLNEPKDAATTVVINPIYACAIAEIRQSNPGRTIVVGPGRWNSVGELKNLILPSDDNIMVSIHCYDPFYFTHQGATWAGPDVKTRGIQYPGPSPQPVLPDPAAHQWVKDWIKKYNTLPTAKNPCSPLAFAGKMKLAREWSDHYGRPVQVGEFGCFTSADPESRARFYRDFRETLAKENIGWTIWDWNAGFHYWDEKKNQPAPGMRHALFGKN